MDVFDFLDTFGLLLYSSLGCIIRLLFFSVFKRYCSSAFGLLGRSWLLDFLDAPGRFLFDALFGLPFRSWRFPSLSRYRHAAKVLWLQ